MRATNYSYSIHGNIVAIVDSLEEDTLPLEKAIEDVVSAIAEKEGIDSRVYAWIYSPSTQGVWDGFSPCTHTFYDVNGETLEDVLIMPALKQKAHFLANNPMIMLEKAFQLSLKEGATLSEVFDLDDKKAKVLTKIVEVFAMDYKVGVVDKYAVYNSVSKFVTSANELAFVINMLSNIVLPRIATEIETGTFEIQI